ncbi:MAG: universal stress protein [Kiloniellales bacterium]|nr:universal stress protein [Kiloniellales bacterium]MDJ0983346.1 universal stress protein [Kiloniellales bacterium]
MFKDILLPVDLGNAESQRKAVKTAVHLAKTAKAQLHVMTVVPDFGLSIVGSFFPEGYEKHALDEASKKLHDFVQAEIPKSVKVQHIVGHGTIYEEILRAANELGCDVIILASHRPELKDYLLGPNAARVARHAACSVMIVRD